MVATAVPNSPETHDTFSKVSALVHLLSTSHDIENFREFETAARLPLVVLQARHFAEPVSADNGDANHYDRQRRGLHSQCHPGNDVGAVSRGACLGHLPHRLVGVVGVVLGDPRE